MWVIRGNKCLQLIETEALLGCSSRSIQIIDLKIESKIWAKESDMKLWTLGIIHWESDLNHREGVIQIKKSEGQKDLNVWDTTIRTRQKEKKEEKASQVKNSRGKTVVCQRSWKKDIFFFFQSAFNRLSTLQSWQLNTASSHLGKEKC